MIAEARYVLPVPGRRVRVPGTYRPLPALGQMVAWSSYWARRLIDGDIEILLVEPPPPAPAPDDALSLEREEP